VSTLPDDVDARVDELVGSPELAQRLGAAARPRHASEFTWEHVAGRYEQLLLPYLGPDRRPTAARRAATSDTTGPAPAIQTAGATGSEHP